MQFPVFPLFLFLPFSPYLTGSIGVSLAALPSSSPLAPGTAWKLLITIDYQWAKGNESLDYCRTRLILRKGALKELNPELGTVRMKTSSKISRKEPEGE